MLSTALLAALAAGLGCSAASRVSTKYVPTLNDTFVYDLDNTPIPAPVITSKYNVSVNAHIYLVDGEQSTPSQIAKYHKEGKKVVCYFSAGTWEPKRNDALNFPPECYCGKGISYNTTTGICTGEGAQDNEDFPWGEWYLNIHEPTCLAKIKKLQLARIDSFIAKGCDGIDPDNTDSYTNPQKFNLTETDAVHYLMWLSQVAKNNSLIIDLKNNPQFLVDDDGKASKYQKQMVENFDFAVIEQCHQYGNCEQWDAFLKAGKPQIQLEYDLPADADDPAYSLTKCPKLQEGQHLLVYNTSDLDTTFIALKCKD